MQPIDGAIMFNGFWLRFSVRCRARRAILNNIILRSEVFERILSQRFSVWIIIFNKNLYTKYARTDERSKTRVKLASTMACKEEEDIRQYLAFMGIP